MKITYADLSEMGSAAAENQDSVFAEVCGELGLFLVADGMGGHEDGAFASAVIRKGIAAYWNELIKNYREKTFPEIRADLEAVINKASREIFSSSSDGRIRGSTVILLFVCRDGYGMLNCGDSRCYQVTGNFLLRKVRQISTDDVWENDPYHIAGRSNDEIISDVNYGRLTRAAGAKEDFSCSVRSDILEKQCVFCLCSDGIYKYADEEVFTAQLKRAWSGRKLEDCIYVIKDNVYEHGAGDNLSVILVSVKI